MSLGGSKAAVQTWILMEYPAYSRTISQAPYEHMQSYPFVKTTLYEALHQAHVSSAAFEPPKINT